VDALYYVNKVVGIGFAVALTAFVGYRVYLWRNEVAKEAGKRFQHRIVEISEQTRREFELNAPKWPDVKFSVDNLQGIKGGVSGQAAKR
jgi:hypothetical protein